MLGTRSAPRPASAGHDCQQEEQLMTVNTSLEWMESSGKWQEMAKPYRDQLGGVFYVERSYEPFGGAGAKAE